MKLSSNISISFDDFKSNYEEIAEKILGNDDSIECEISCNYSKGYPARFNVSQMQWDAPDYPEMDDLECIYNGEDIIDYLNSNSIGNIEEKLVNSIEDDYYEED